MFKFISDDSDCKCEEKVFPNVTFTMPSESNLDDMIEAFEHFLKASGYNFDGELDFIGATEESEDEGGIE